MNKIFAAIAALAMITSLSACSDKEPSAYASTEAVELNTDGSVDYNSQTVVVPNE